MAYRMVLVTTKDQAQAVKIANVLVVKKLAACCNIIPSIRSIYRWEGKVCDDREALLIIKTSSAKFTALEKKVKALHSYSVPEIIALPVAAGNAAYLKWLASSLK